MNETAHRVAPLRHRGVSLVELMVAMVIGLLITGALLALFNGMQRSYRLAEASSWLQEDARYAADVIGTTLRAAGYTGCGVGNSVVYAPAGADMASLKSRLEDGEALAPLSDTSVSLLSPMGPAYRVSEVNADSSTIEVESDDRALNWPSGSVLLINDCQSIAIVRTNAAMSLSAGSSGSVAVTAAGLGNLNIDADAPAIVVRIEEQVLDLDGGDTLRLAGAPLLSGIESMSLLYGISNGSNTIQQFVRHDGVGGSQILAVRFELLLRSENDVLASAGEQQYYFDGQLRQSNDRRLRYAIGGTVWLRNP